MAGLSAKKTGRWQAINLLNPADSYTFDRQQISSKGVHLVLQKAETAILQLNPQH
jgi:hypothetical protein